MENKTIQMTEAQFKEYEEFQFFKHEYRALKKQADERQREEERRIRLNEDYSLIERRIEKTLDEKLGLAVAVIGMLIGAALGAMHAVSKQPK